MRRLIDLVGNLLEFGPPGNRPAPVFGRKQAAPETSVQAFANAMVSMQKAVQWSGGRNLDQIYADTAEEFGIPVDVLRRRVTPEIAQRWVNRSVHEGDEPECKDETDGQPGA